MKKIVFVLFFVALWMLLLNLATFGSTSLFICPRYTCLVLSFVLFSLSYKLVEYLEDVGVIKNYPKTNSIFVVMFFLLLFVPMSHINGSEKSLVENRYLARFKPVIDKKINSNFGKDFDLWFNDRFFLRYNMINTYNRIRLFLENKNDKVIINPKTKFMYEISEFKAVDANKLKYNFRGLYKFNDFCKKNNIKLYVVITPRKSDVHKLNYNIVNNEKSSKELLDFIKDLQKNNVLNIIYPYEILKRASENNYMFFKSDHHWTEDAAFITYQELMNLIKRDFPNVEALDESSFDNFYSSEIRSGFERMFFSGATCYRLGVDYRYCNGYEDVKYRYYTHKDFKNLQVKVTDIDYQREKIFYYPKGADLRVIMLGTSMSEQLTEFIPFTFKNVKRIRNNSVKKVPKEDEFKIMKRYRQEILDYKPDIIIFTVSYGNLSRLKYIFEN